MKPRWVDQIQLGIHHFLPLFTIPFLSFLSLRSRILTANTHLPWLSEFEYANGIVVKKNRLSNQICVVQGKLFIISEPISSRSIVVILQDCCDFQLIAHSLIHSNFLLFFQVQLLFFFLLVYHSAHLGIHTLPNGNNTIIESVIQNGKNEVININQD